MKRIIQLVKENKRICFLSLPIVLLVAVFFVVYFVFFTNQIKVTNNELVLYITHGDQREVNCLYGTDRRVYEKVAVNASKQTTLHITDGRDDVTDMYIWLTDDKGNISYCEQVKTDKSHIKLQLDSVDAGVYNISFVAIGSAGMEYYVSDEYSFMQVISDSRVENQSVNMMTDINIDRNSEENIVVKYPFVWNSDGYSFSTEGKLQFESELQGCMVINNGGNGVFSTGIVSCDTPLWDYSIEQLFGQFDEVHYYYINANTVNNRDIDTSHMYVDSQDKMNGIISYEQSDSDTEGGYLNVDDYVKKLSIVGDFKLGKVYVDRAISIEMSGDIDVIYEGKELDLIWDGDYAPTIDTIERYMSIKSYNGVKTDENIGGAGSCQFVSGSLKLSADRVNDMIVEGNYIDVYIGYADTIVPSEATFKCQLDGDGKAVVVKKGDNYYCMVTDNENQVRGYKINLIEKQYNLPVIYIETENGQAITSKEVTIPGSFTIEYNGEEEYSSISDVSMTIRGRGKSSWKLKKKPYKIKFDKKQSLFGLTEAKEWVLQANHADKSLIRNKLAMDMGQILDNVLFTPHAYMVDVFVNGEYMGVYNIVEQIEVKSGRIEGEKDSTQVDTDYLLEMCGDEDKTSFGTNMFSSSLSKWMEVKNPDSDILTKEQFEYIKDYVTKADDAVSALEGYEEYIDVPSLIDWFLMCEFSYNVDGAFRRSVFIGKQKGGKLHMATYWDYDYAFGNFWRDSAAFDEWICLGNENTKKDNYIWTNWMTYLLTDKNFTTQLKARWEQVGEQLYTTAMATIDDAAKNVSLSAEENFIRWQKVLGYKTQYEFWKTKNISTYEGQLQYLRDFVEKRYKWMDKTIKGM